MAGRTISATYNSLVTLTNGGDNPVLVDATAALDAGLYGVSGTDWTVTNNGVITTGVDGSNAARTPGAAVLMASESTITNYGSIGASGSYGVGVYLEAGGSVSNQGQITASGKYGYGIYLTGGGTVTNYGTVHGAGLGIDIRGQAGTLTNAGTIIGDLDGIQINHGGTVVNQGGGIIRGHYNGAFLQNAGGVVLTNAGTIEADNIGATSFGVAAPGGGVVTNQAGGVIAGYSAGIQFYNGGAGTVVNAGTIVGSAVGAAAIAFAHDYDNLLVVEPGAVFVGTVDGGDTIGGAHVNTLELAPGTVAGTLDGLGYQFINFATINVDASADWVLTDANSIEAGALLTVAGTLENAGTLSRYGGIVLAAGGTIINDQGAYILSKTVYPAIYGIFGTGPGTVINDGLITLTADSGVELDAGGLVLNDLYGTITGGVYGVRISGAPGTLINYGYIYGLGGAVSVSDGVVYNHSGGTIGGAYGVSMKTGVLTNAGVINGYSGPGYAGVLLESASFTNEVNGYVGALSSGVSVTSPGGAIIANYGTIIGNIGVYGAYSTTLFNAGTISGNGNPAVKLLPGDSHLVVVAPAAVFDGQVDGGNAIGSTVVSTLELTYGFAIGTLSGIGSQYVNFAYITVDYGATWELAGTNSIAAGATLISSGDLGVSGTLINAGSIGDGVGSGYGLITVLDGSVTNALGGSISSSHGVAIYSPAGGAAVTVVNAGHVYGYDIGVYLGSGGVVTNLSSGTIGGGGGVGIIGGVGTLVNQGSIYGIYSGVFVESGMVTNSASARITGGFGGVRIGGGTLSNYGRIAGTGPSALPTYGVALGDATLINHVGGKISGIGYGVSVSGSVAGTIVNEGSIGGGVAGVYGYSETTLINSGTITTLGYDSVELSKGYANLLVINPGAVFNGAVDGNFVPSCGCYGPGTETSTMELASGGIGTLGGLGSQYIGFAAITIDSSASWVLTGSNSLAAGITLTNSGALTLSSASLIDADTLVNNGVIVLDPSTLSVEGLIGVGNVTIGSGGELDALGIVAIGETIDLDGAGGVLALGDPADFAGTIDGFVSGRTIDLTGVPHSAGDHATLLAGNTLEVVTSGSGTFDLQLDPSRDYTGATFPLSANGGGTDINTSVACFADGTRLLTPLGLVAVESLREGDRVLNASGVARSVQWVGVRFIDISRHADPDAVRPIRILPGAFADGVPACEVRLSPDHAVLVDGVLVPIRLLVNGASIVRAVDCRSVRYYHVELDTHDVLLAEGMPAESYLDTGNRGMFANADVPMVLHPDFGEGQRRRVAGCCAPFVSEAARVEPMWRRLMARACLLGFAEGDASGVVDDTALRVMVGGRLIAASCVEGARHCFVLPRTDGAVRLVSRWFVPNAVQPWEEDRRRLGVMVRRLMLRVGGVVEEVPVDCPLLGEGWWGVERDRGAVWRWTDGDALLPLPVGAGGGVLEVLVGVGAGLGVGLRRVG